MKKNTKREKNLEEELALLKAEIRELRCHKVVHEMLISMAKDDLKIDLKKNFEANVLKSLNLSKKDLK